MAVNIELDNNWAIESEGRCFALVRKKIVQSGKRKGNIVKVKDSYFSNLREMLLRIPDRVAMESDATTLDELLDTIKKYTKLIEKSFRNSDYAS